MHKQQGFTLIELVMVIVILGILAATALPKFVDLQEEARLGAAKGVAGAIASETAINYGIMAAGNASGKGKDVASCTDVVDNLGTAITGVTLIKSGTPTDGQYLIGTGSGTCSAGAAITCTVQPYGSSSTVNATVICTKA